MKVLIINNCFKRSFKYLPRLLKKFLNFYTNLKLKQIINFLIKKHPNDIQIKVLNVDYEKLNLNKNMEFISLSNFRLNLDRDKYVNLRDKIINATKQNLSKFFNNIQTLKNLSYKGISIANALEFELITLFNEYFGQYELLKRKIKTNLFDTIILFNFESDSLSLFHSLNFNHNIKVYSDNFLIRIQSILKIINITTYLIITFGLFLKRGLFKRITLDYPSNNLKKKPILFFTDTKNQFYSIKPVYDGLMKYKNEDFIPRQYSCEKYLHFNTIPKLLKFLLKIRKIIIKNKESILNGLKFESFNLYGILKLYYDYDLFFRLINIFNMLNNLTNFIGKNPPILVVISNDSSIRGRLEIGYFKLKNIPVVYIPHSGILIMEELATMSQVSYITVPGGAEKKHLIHKGEPSDKIVVTGRPRYEQFHKGKIEKLIEVKDMFNARKYNFNSKKFTVLLTTNPIDEKSNEKIISSVVNSLKELNLIDNLIIKLHPREDGKIHKKILRKLEVNPLIVKDYDILQLIKSSNLLLSRVSNTVVESMIIGTPVILLDFININFIFTSRYVFTEEKVLIRVKNQKELRETLQKLIENKDFYNKYSKDLNNLSKGYSFYDEKQNPTEKIINLFLKEIRDD
ncbi:MAG: UDP-N-acetylglucosamine 2-epimerase [Promethearchaeota archaeon]